MVLPIISDIQENVTYTNIFQGVNLQNSITESEFSDMENMTNDYFPAIGTRKKRGKVADLPLFQGMVGGRWLSYVKDDYFYFDEMPTLQLAKTGKKRTLLNMGAYIVIFPDGVMYNTNDESVTYINIDRTTTQNPTFTLCKLDGTAYNDSNTVVSSSAPSTDKYWIDTSADTVVMKMYSPSQSQWVSVATTYVKISATGIGTGIKKYDAVTLSDVDTGADKIYNGFDFNTSNIVYDCGTDYIVVVGLINKVFTNSKPIKVQRMMPDMDFVCELDNRIWGCSTENHEIYACKLGDPTNWRFYGGLDSDSYAVTVGTQNVFTGCASFAGSAFFFKEDGFHRVYGNKPSNFEVSWKAGRGVQYGSSKSIAVVGDVLFFKSKDSICGYDGSTNTLSDKLDVKSYFDAVGGVYRDKYYVCMRDDNYIYRTYVYDTSKGTWCIEDLKSDPIQFVEMAYANTGLYMMSVSGALYVSNYESIQVKWFPSSDEFPSSETYAGNRGGGETESALKWSITTGDIGMDTPYQKYIKRVDIRMLIDTNAMVRVEVMYDSSDSYIVQREYFCTKKRSIDLPIAVKRCDHFKLRLSGFGDVRIFGIAKHIEQGSEN